MDVFLTDDWEAFRAVLPKAKYLIGKVVTKVIEGGNICDPEQEANGPVRRTVYFSKKLIYHYSDENHHLA